MLRVECVLARIERVGLVDAHVQNVPFKSIGAALELPVAQDVGNLVAVTKCVESWTDSALLADVDAHEAEGLVLGAAVLGASANEGLHETALGHRAGESLNDAERVWVLPQSALAERSEIVECTLLVKVVIENKLCRRHELHLLLHQQSLLLLLFVATWSHSVRHGVTLGSIQVRHVLQLAGRVILL